MYAVAMAYVKYHLGEEGGQIWLYLGPKRPPSAQRLEVILEENTEDQTVFIFHSMPMRPKWQYLLDEQQKGS